MQELINQVADIVEKYRSEREQIGLDYNVFTLMDIERGAKVHPDFSVAMRNLNDDRQIVVLSENKKQLTLLRQTNKSLGAIVANTRTQQRNYNRVWN